jgi:hypothetical protein
MCIVHFHVHACEANQYEVKCAALAYGNLNVPCESGIYYPSLVAMLNRPAISSRIMVIYHDAHAHV